MHAPHPSRCGGPPGRRRTCACGRPGWRELTDYDADIAGAKEVSGAEANYTATDGKPYRALTVDALLDDGETVVALTAGGRPEDKIDLEGVVKSLKLKGRG